MADVRTLKRIIAAAQASGSATVEISIRDAQALVQLLSPRPKPVTQTEYRYYGS